MATKKPRPLGDDSFLVVSSSKRSRAVVTRDVEFCPKCRGSVGGRCDFCGGTGKSDTFHRPQPRPTGKTIRAKFREERVEDMVETFNRTQRPHTHG